MEKYNKRPIRIVTLMLLSSCNLLGPTPSSGPEEESIESIAAKAIEIPQAADNIGVKGTWVKGYIIGGDLTSKNISFAPPFSAASNIAIGISPETTERSECLSVSLPQGRIRNALNLVTNPSLLGRQCYIQGEIVPSYFGMIGIKNLTDFRLAAEELDPGQKEEPAQ